MVTYAYCHKDDDDNEKCKKLMADLYEAMFIVEDRLAAMYVDNLNLYNLARWDANPTLPPGAGSWRGHGEQVLGWKNRLRNIINKMLAAGCRIPPYAWELLKAPIPDRPAFPIK